MNLRIQEPRAPKNADVAMPVGGVVPVAVPAPVSPIRGYLQSRGNSSLADSTFRWLMLLCALSIFGIVALIATELVTHSQITLAKFGWKFFVGSAWDPVNANFGALPFIYGTIMTSIVALIIAVPLAVGVAVFLTEMCPKALRGGLSFLTELLAAIPSVVYGLWAVFVLVPLLRTYINPFLIDVLGWTGFFTRPDFGIGMFAAGVIHYFIDRHFHPETASAASFEKLLTYFLAFLVIDFVTSALAFSLERRHPASKGDGWLLFHIWLQRFAYRQVFSIVLFKTIKRAIDGRPFNWEKIERTAKMSQRTESIAG